MNFLKKLFSCKNYRDVCDKNLLGCKCGGGGGDSDDPPPQKTPAEIAREQVSAQVESIPRAAELNFDVLTNPEFGLLPTTQAFEDVRQQVFPNENAVRTQLVQNILQQLTSPTGITSDQQQAIDTRRGQAQDKVTTALRTRANLGGGLFGGRAQNTEQKAVQDLQNQFVEEDVNREERSRLNNSQLALQVLNLLFPGSGIQTPQFINPVQSPDTTANADIAARGQDISVQQAALNRQAQLQSALYESVGNVLGAGTGAAFGAGGAFGQPVA